ncbi:formate dehydrogenase [Salinarimonas soli]|uniref:Formate dehydrogenase n=1 Tax=Salinarimonas soli TaxID=1638099 RepID=A0A5B2VFN6_9HYPH|nr:formate dehydrogenase [Salinarimonas soli]KAA2237162.1 formate dehydrogenase [Salinarimonas soli]
MTRKTDDKALDRRGFFKAVGGATTVAAAAVASPLAAPEAAAQASDDERRARYRETDHVKAFYRTNGYETLKK